MRPVGREVVVMWPGEGGGCGGEPASWLAPMPLPCPRALQESVATLLLHLLYHDVDVTTLPYPEIAKRVALSPHEVAR